jgi:glycine/D-amino acid oxidase-like deaminating enzyme
LDLTSPHAYWLISNGVGRVSDPLTRDMRADVVVIGAGITGALVCDSLTRAGLSVIALDKRHPAHGSTSASTAMLMYELDTPLIDLVARVGSERAVDAYAAALHGVQIIAQLAGDLEQDVGFCRRSTLYLASRKSDIAKFRKESLARKEMGLPCELLESRAIRDVLDFDAPLALWSDAGAEVDPWRLTCALLSRCLERDFKVFGRTEVTEIAANGKTLEARTPGGTIRARHVVVAAGYEAGTFLPQRVASLHSTYAAVTEPVKDFTGWKNRCLVWESARPYHYMRTTEDNRVMIGGEDDAFRNPAHRDALVPVKAKRLLAKARRFLPRIEMDLAYAWAGTFAETKDGLPYIGGHPAVDPRVLFALAYGANGMPFGAVAAEVLTATALGKRHRYQTTFDFDR